MSITVTNNPDGTFTVSCGTESVIIGTKKKGYTGSTGIVSTGRVATPGGFVTASIVDAAKAPAGATRARDTKDLLAKMKAQISAAAIPGTKGKHKIGKDITVKPRLKPKVLHFSLTGKQTIDVGKIAAITAGSDASHSVVAHVHFNKPGG